MLGLSLAAAQRLVQSETGVNAMIITHHPDYLNRNVCLINEYVNECPERIGRHLFCGPLTETHILNRSGSNPGCGRWHKAR